MAIPKDIATNIHIYPSFPASVHHRVVNAVHGTTHLKPLSWAVAGNLHPIITEGLTELLTYVLGI
jgi:hypothetical protein